MRSIVVFAALLSSIYAGPITIPLTPDGEVNKIIPEYLHPQHIGKTYHIPKPPADNISKNRARTSLDHRTPSCQLDFQLEWTVQTEGPIVSTPVIFPSYSQSEHKSILINTAQQYVELIEGNGKRPAGWPISFQHSQFFTSPLVFDIDGDGHQDVGAVDYHGNLFFTRIGEYGQYLSDFHVSLPNLQVKKNWWAGSEAFSDVMVSMFDRVDWWGHEFVDPRAAGKKAKLDPLSSEEEEHGNTGGEDGRRRLQAEEEEEEEEEEEGNGEHNMFDFEHPPHHDSPAHADHADHPEHFDAAMHWPEDGMDGENSADGKDSAAMDMEYSYGLPFVPPDQTYEHNGLDGADPNIDHSHLFPGIAEEQPPAPEQESESNEPGLFTYYYGTQGDGTPRRDRRWVEPHNDDHSYYMSRKYGGDIRMAETDDTYQSLPPHVLATPAVVDTDRDGHMEIIFPASYFLDSSDTSAPGSNASMYFASALVCFDMFTQEYIWTTHLDLSSNLTGLAARIHTQPVVVDLDGEGSMEVIIGTELGMLYILDGSSGHPLPHFPLPLGPLYASPAVGNVHGEQDGELEVVVGDGYGNVLVINGRGEVLWDVRLGTHVSESNAKGYSGGGVHFTPTLGDVDQDGRLDVVVSVWQGRAEKGRQRGAGSVVYVLQGHTGNIMYVLSPPQDAFISAPILLVSFPTPSRVWDEKLAQDIDGNSSSLLRGDKRQGKDGEQGGEKVHLLVTTLDGHLYVINPGDQKNGDGRCMQSVDMGGVTYTPPLLADLSTSSTLDLLVCNAGGDMSLYRTPAVVHSENIWSSVPRYRSNNYMSREGVGVIVSQAEKRRLKDWQYKGLGEIPIHFSISDPLGCSTPPCFYNVTINSGAEVLYAHTYTAAGHYRADISFSSPGKYVLTLRVEDRHGIVAEEALNVNVSTELFKFLKFFVLAPVLLLTGLVYVVSKQHD